MILEILPFDIILYILKYMDNSDDFNCKNILNFVTCNKKFMNILIKSNVKFHKKSYIYNTSPFFSYDTTTNNIIDNNVKKIYLTDISLDYICNVLSKKNCLREIFLDTNINLDLILLNSVEHITFGYIYNQPIKNLPESLTHLTFGNLFNQSVDNLPKNLTHLTFGNLLNQSVDNLPKKLTHLTLGRDFNQSVDNLPESLTCLIFDEKFNNSINKLPKKLKKIIFKYWSKFNQQVNNLPNSITHLTFGWIFNQLVDKLPSSLMYLSFGNIFNQQIDNLPKNLIHLTFTEYSVFNHNIDNLPDSLIELKLGNTFNKKINKVPKNLKFLKIGYGFNKSSKILQNIPQLFLDDAHKTLKNKILRKIKYIF